VNKGKVQLIVVLVVFGLWVFGMILAQFDGNELLKIITPFMTMVFGWLFAEKATSG
jgi:hypothetical protein